MFYKKQIKYQFWFLNPLLALKSRWFRLRVPVVSASGDGGFDFAQPPQVQIVSITNVRWLSGDEATTTRSHY